MFCEETCGFSVGSLLSGDLRVCDLPQKGGQQTEPSGRTLYASLWHCPACEQNVRVYSRLTKVISGSIRKDCPTCGGQMEAIAAAEPHPQVDSSTRTTLVRPRSTSAWAA